MSCTRYGECNEENLICGDSKGKPLQCLPMGTYGYRWQEPGDNWTPLGGGGIARIGGARAIPIFHRLNRLPHPHSFLYKPSCHNHYYNQYHLRNAGTNTNINSYVEMTPLSLKKSKTKSKKSRKSKKSKSK